MALPLLTCDQIEAALDLKAIQVDVPEWNGSVEVGALTVEERDTLISACTDNGRHDGKMDSNRFVRMLVVLGVKNPRLTEDFLKKRSYKVVDRLATIIMELSGMKEGDSVKADVTFRQESGSPISIPTGQGTA